MVPLGKTVCEANGGLMDPCGSARDDGLTAAVVLGPDDGSSGGRRVVEVVVVVGDVLESVAVVGMKPGGGREEGAVVVAEGEAVGGKGMAANGMEHSKRRFCGDGLGQGGGGVGGVGGLCCCCLEISLLSHELHSFLGSLDDLLLSTSPEALPEDVKRDADPDDCEKEKSSDPGGGGVDLEEVEPSVLLVVVSIVLFLRGVDLLARLSPHGMS